MMDEYDVLYAESSIKFKDDLRGIWSIPFISGLTGYDLNEIVFMTEFSIFVQGPGRIVKA